MASLVVQECSDPNRLIAVLGNDRVKNAYLIGSTVPEYAEHARWFQMVEEGETKGVIEVYEGLSVPVIFTWGAANHVASLVSRLCGHFGDRMLIHKYPEHSAAFQGCAEVISARRMVRMTVTRDTFKPASGDTQVVQLSHSDTAGILRLYSLNPDNFFDPYQLESGYYFGIREGDELVSVAGIHLIHQTLRFAMLGNVVTAPEKQGRGYGSLVTSTLCKELFRFSEVLILDVPMENGRALRVFSKLGFSPCFYYDQALAKRIRTSFVESQA